VSQLLPLEVRQQQFLALLAPRASGISCRDLAKHVGLSEQRTAEVLRSLRRQGLVLTTADGRHARWALTAAAEMFRAYRATLGPPRRRRDYRAEKAAAHLSFLRARHIVVPAAAAKPLRTTAPNSVFHLAA
jgi:DNA-binding IclR family transcriptional regulator